MQPRADLQLVRHRDRKHSAPTHAIGLEHLDEIVATKHSHQHQHMAKLP